MQTQSTATSGLEPASMNETMMSKEQKSSQLEDHGPVNSDVASEGEVQYVTGVKLGVILLGVIVIALLIMLDMSIIATVRRLP
jgi:hypothetical protein